VGVIWLTPVFGSLVYFVLGINRVHRRAFQLRRNHIPRKRFVAPHKTGEVAIAQPVLVEKEHLGSLVRYTAAVTGQHLYTGNQIRPLIDGEQGYPEMLSAIEKSNRCVSLSSYIFANDVAGLLFVDALRKAIDRGVAVRVLVDGIGAHYSWPKTIINVLHKAQIPHAEFLPSFWPWQFNYANMRSHRKILVVDGQIGFTGGMNISAQNNSIYHPKEPVQDIHFRIEGPIVGRLQEAFADDWLFSTGESLDEDLWFPALQERGPMLVRGVTSGPDADLDKLRMIYLGAVTCARERIRIITPYYLPDAGLIDALNAAALRGVQVDLFVPIRNNMRLVQWASMMPLAELLEHGGKVWLTAEPFDHSKLVLVDEAWTFFGSANWDPRSLRLNFEFNLECYSLELAKELSQILEGKQAQARPLTLADIQSRSLPIRLRDGIAALLTPYL
jgi:cardiolipin synthase